MKVHSPLSKVEMIERSMRCFTLGLLALLPMIGIPMAVMSLAQYRRVKHGQGTLFWGALCARAGLWPFLIAAVLLAVAAWLFPDAIYR
jgi:hypothetical protein